MLKLGVKSRHIPRDYRGKRLGSCCFFEFALFAEEKTLGCLSPASLSPAASRGGLSGGLSPDLPRRAVVSTQVLLLRQINYRGQRVWLRKVCGLEHLRGKARVSCFVVVVVSAMVVVVDGAVVAKNVSTSD